MLRWLLSLLGGDAGRLDMAELARRLGASEQELRGFEPRYRRFTIPKRRGGRRTILAPEPRLAQLQRRILRRVLALLRAHPAACGFERGRSIVHAALPHVCRQIVLRLDIADFFANTTAVRVQRYFRDIGWRKEPAAVLARLCTFDGGPPQGAPTSPRLANLVNHKLDARLAGLARHFAADYTRYADDLIFSADTQNPVHSGAWQASDQPAVHRRLTGILPTVKAILGEHGYQLHQGPKLRIMRRHHRQQVTGLVVNDRIALPRQRRRWLRAVEHRFATGRPASISADQLQGWQALRQMIERQSRDA